MKSTIPLTRTRLLPLAAAFAAALTCADSARAQIPDGHAVIGTKTQPFSSSYLPGTPGLFHFPVAGGPAAPITPITGLPAVLTTDGLGAYGQGTQSVSIRSADGAVIVGTLSGWLSPTMGQVELIVLHLNVTGTGTAVVGTQRIALGAAGAGNFGAAWNAVLPNGEILVVAAGSGGPLAGPMAGSVLARVNTTTGIITPLPNPPAGPAGADLGGIAVDPTGQFVYYGFATAPFTAGSTSTLHRYDLTAGTTCPTPIATWPGQTAFGVQCDDDGTVYVSSTDPTTGAHFMHTVRPNGCNPATVTSVASAVPLFAWGFDLDRASGQFVAASAPLSQNALFRIDSTGTSTPLTAAPTSGWGSLSPHGVAVNNAIESYGARSDGQNHYWFENFPNPGGQPAVGSRGFSLTMRAAPGAPLASALWLSAGRGSVSVFGIEILVDLASTIPLFVPAGSSVPVPMPIPAVPALRGAALTAQSIHLEPAGVLAASRGLQVTLQ